MKCWNRAVGALTLGWSLAAVSAAPNLASVAAGTGAEGAGSAYDGVVEAVRQTVIAAQVPGAVVALAVKAGDSVKAGQVLARLDARAAVESANAAAAQTRVAGAELDIARREVERQRALLAKQYISPAAFEKAEARFKAAEAQVAAQNAQAGAARTQTGFYVLTAPYAGVIADVSIVQGDMAMPGRPLMTLYDPAAMRVTAPLPQSLVSRSGSEAVLKAASLDLPGAAGRTATRVTVLPAADPATHTVPVRFDLAPGTQAAPGAFARVWLGAADAEARVRVPASAVVRRAELTALYVLDEAGKPLLRQVRLGRIAGDQVEVLSGVSRGERVVLDPQAAAKAK